MRFPSSDIEPFHLWLLVKGERAKAQVCQLVCLVIFFIIVVVIRGDVPFSLLQLHGDQPEIGAWIKGQAAGAKPSRVLMADCKNQTI